MTEKNRSVFADSGFTLFEIMLVITIVAVVSSFGFGIISSVKGMSDTVTTQNRMTVIAAKAQDYYRGHGVLPDPDDTIEDDDSNDVGVPTRQSALDLEQKYRLDAWGQYFEYRRGSDIVQLNVNGNYVAGVLISGGPDEEIQTSSVAGTGDDAGKDIYITDKDDILVPINVSAQAVEVALEELRVLQEKARAYDKIYEQDLDNNGTTMDDCVALVYNGTVSCPSSVPISGTAYQNDPSCGWATLDSWASYSCSSPYDTVLNFIVNWYGLGDEYLTDPWGRDYVWGAQGYVLEDGSSIIDSSDVRYHKFFSEGPDDTNDADDITP